MRRQLRRVPPAGFRAFPWPPPPRAPEPPPAPRLPPRESSTHAGTIALVGLAALGWAFVEMALGSAECRAAANGMFCGFDHSLRALLAGGFALLAFVVAVVVGATGRRSEP